MAAAAQMNLLTKVTEVCDSVMQRLAHTPGQQKTPPREPRPHLTVPVYMGYDDVESVADFLGELQTYHLASGTSEAFIAERIVPLALQASARCWLGSQAPLTSLADFQTKLREEFLPAGYATQILRELEARTQHPDESLVWYVWVIQELFKRADPKSPESDRVARVRRQCHPRYHVYLINRTFETIEELARGARLIEEALHAERNYVPPPPAKYALVPACAWRGPEASTQVGCPNETSLPHHVNQESWRGMHGDLPCGISVHQFARDLGCAATTHLTVDCVDFGLAAASGATGSLNSVPGHHETGPSSEWCTREGLWLRPSCDRPPGTMRGWKSSVTENCTPASCVASRTSHEAPPNCGAGREMRCPKTRSSAQAGVCPNGGSSFHPLPERTIRCTPSCVSKQQPQRR
ncbi:hypothetical protein ISCGN_006815 [Ixodes scapularis]